MCMLNDIAFLELWRGTFCSLEIAGRPCFAVAAYTAVAAESKYLGSYVPRYLSYRLVWISSQVGASWTTFCPSSPLTHLADV